MFKLEEVLDESFANQQPGPLGDENDWDDTDDTGTHRVPSSNMKLIIP
jgi:hypothetical protein